MSRRSRRRDRATALEAGRAALGVLHLVRSRPRAAAKHGEVGPDPTRAFDRILGVRQLVQAALLTRSGSPNAHTLGALVDLVHAISMLPLALVDPRRRRFAAEQFFVALLLTVLEIWVVGTGSRRRGGRGR
jgi:hypothetical protein